MTQEPLPAIEYFNRFHEQYAYESLRNATTTEKEEQDLAEEVASIFQRPQGIRILDVGCGPGCQWDGRPESYTLIGLDGSENMLDTARNSGYFNELVQVDLSNEDVQWPIESGSFDLVICKNTLQYLPNAQHMIACLLDATKLNGFIYINFYFWAGVLQSLESKPYAQTFFDSGSITLTSVQEWAHPPDLVIKSINGYGGEIMMHKELPFHPRDPVEHGMLVQKRAGPS